MRRVATFAGVFAISLGAAAASVDAAASTVAVCRLARLVVSLGPYVSEATGQHTLALRLVNHGPRTCLLDGYPQVRLYDAKGAIPFVIRHGGDQMISPRPPRSVVVRPGGAAFVVLNKYRCDLRSERATTRITISAAAARAGGSASISFSRAHKILFPYRVPDYCGKGDPGSIITVSPFVPTVRAALDG